MQILASSFIQSAKLFLGSIQISETKEHDTIHLTFTENHWHFKTRDCGVTKFLFIYSWGAIHILTIYALHMVP